MANYNYVVKYRGQVAAHTTTKAEADKEARRVGGKVEYIGKPEQIKNPLWGETTDFLESIIKEYGEDFWRENWWRECVQNSVDNGASKVNLTCEKQDDGNRLVSCDDDGTGMDLATLVGKFLTLGGSGKKNTMGNKFAGGFGKAKELLLFPWLSWEVRSRNALAFGVGKDELIIKCIPCNSSMPHVKTNSPEAADWVTQHNNCRSQRTGTILAVVMDSANHTEEAFAKVYLSKCYLPNVAFKVNGERAKASLAASSMTREWAGACGYFVENAKKSADSFIVFRVHGQAMWSNHLNSDIHGVIIIELTGAATDLLTVNRNGFSNRNLETAIWNYRRELGVDKDRAIKQKAGILREPHKGIGTFKAEDRIRTAKRNINVQTITKTGHGITFEIVTKETIADVLNEVHTENRAIKDPVDPGEFVGRISGELANVMLSGNITVPQMQASIDQLLWKPDYFLYNDVRGLKLGKHFRPSDMPKKMITLLKIWAEMCRYVMIQCGAPEHFGVGFGVSDYFGACYLNRDDIHWLLLNPFISVNGEYTDTTLKNIKDPNSVGLWKHLYAVAIHEVSHFANGFVGYSSYDVEDKLGEHNGAFVSAFTANTELCIAGWDKVERIAKLITQGADIELEKGLEISDETGKKTPKKQTPKPSPTITTIESGDTFAVAVKYPDSAELFKSNDVRVYNPGTVAEFLSDYLTYEVSPEPGTVLYFTLAGTDNVFVYKIGQRAELKGKPIFVESQGTPKVVKERTRMPSPDKVKMVEGDKYREGWGAGVIQWGSWEEYDNSWRGYGREVSATTVQEFADAGINNRGTTHYQVQTAYGTYTFKRGRQGAVAGKAIHVRENPEY